MATIQAKVDPPAFAGAGQPPIDPAMGLAMPPKPRLLRRLLGYTRRYPRLVTSIVISGAAGIALAFVYPWLIGTVIDTVVAPQGEWVDADRESRLRMLRMLTGIGVAAALAHSVVLYIRGHATVTVGNRIARDLRRALYDHFQRLSLQFYSKERTGTLVSRMIHDVNNATGIIYSGGLLAALDAVQFFAAIALLCVVSIELAAACLLILPLYVMALRYFNPMLREAGERVASKMGSLGGTVQERLAGIALVKAYSAEQRESALWSRENEEFYGRAIRQSSVSHLAGGITELLVHSGTCIVIGFGGYLALSGDLTAGDLTRFLGYLGILYGPVRRFADLNTSYQTSSAAMRRVFQVLDIEPKVSERPEPVAREPTQGHVRFASVRFRYIDESPESQTNMDEDPPQASTPPSTSPAAVGATVRTDGVLGRARRIVREPSKWIFDDLSFDVPAGQRVALVGPSGSGKTTLVSLIPRLYDVSEGSVFIDDIDVRDYALTSLRYSISVVQQEAFLFTGSVWDNILYGKPDATRDEVIEAATVANAHDFIMSMPQGYDTAIQEAGRNLSGGQRQRLAIARAAIRKSRIVILDEATSALDTESETLVTEALNRLMLGRTCFIIAHRLSTVRSVDRVLVLKDGRIVEDGHHDDLIARAGFYARMVRQQFTAKENSDAA